MLKFSEIFEFSSENSYFERIRMVRMVRSLADRTFQLWFEAGRLPAPDRIAAMLRAESCRDIEIVNLEDCGRRDIGQLGVVATCTNARHCRRVGLRLENAVKAADYVLSNSDLENVRTDSILTLTFSTSNYFLTFSNFSKTIF